MYLMGPEDALRRPYFAIPKAPTSPITDEFEQKMAHEAVLPAVEFRVTADAVTQTLRTVLSTRRALDQCRNADPSPSVVSTS